MAGSVFGTLFRVSTWGESHGPAIGAVVDGCPAGLPLTEEDFTPYMERRRPNGGALSTKRIEADQVEILSGVFEGKTTGTPISLLIRNNDQHSSDYDALRDIYRPGHADFGYDSKYGFRDHRGGGRSSGRETAGRVAAGAIAVKGLAQLGITFDTRVLAIGGIPFEDTIEIEKLLADCRAEGDSIGSEVLCTVRGVPAGIGEPVFDKLDALLSEAIFSIGAVKALDIGCGREAALLRGSRNNDAFVLKQGAISKETNHSGGILGGISDGSDLLLHVFFKPTPSIASSQHTVSRSGQEKELFIHGRHDPVIGPRAAVVVEAMSALVIFDCMLRNLSSRMCFVEQFYQK